MFITLPNRLDAERVSQHWAGVFHRLQKAKPLLLILDASMLEHIDGAGIAFLLMLQRRQADRQGRFEILNLGPTLRQFLDTNTLEGLVIRPPQETSFRRVAEDVGQAGYSIVGDIRSQINFLGELGYKLVSSLRHPLRIRWKDFFLLAEKAGADAISITALSGTVNRMNHSLFTGRARY